MCLSSPVIRLLKHSAKRYLLRLSVCPSKPYGLVHGPFSLDLQVDSTLALYYINRHNFRERPMQFQHQPHTNQV